MSDFIGEPNLELDPIAEQRLELLDMQSRLHGPEFESLVRRTDEFIGSNPYCRNFMRNLVEIKPIVAVTWHGTNTSCPFEIYSIRYFGIGYESKGKIVGKQYDVEVASALAGLVLPVTSNIVPSESELEVVAEHVEELKFAKETDRLPDLDSTLSHIRIP